MMDDDDDDGVVGCGRISFFDCFDFVRRRKKVDANIHHDESVAVESCVKSVGYSCHSCKSEASVRLLF